MNSWRRRSVRGAPGSSLSILPARREWRQRNPEPPQPAPCELFLLRALTRSPCPPAIRPLCHLYSPTVPVLVLAGSSYLRTMSVCSV